MAMSERIDIAEYIEPIEINGLSGRVLNLPTTNKKARRVELLFVYGHHTSIERLAGVAKLLSRYGNVCIPDLPGFGGMQPLYRIGQKPTIDNLADYLAAFVRMRYRSNRKVVMCGFSFGFMVLTRMYQKYPDLRGKVESVISLAGFLHNDNFTLSLARKRFYYLSAWAVCNRPLSFAAREIFFRKWFMGTIYTRLHNAKHKFDGLDKQTLKKMTDFEVHLWRCNDMRTYCYTAMQFLRADLVTNSEQLDLNLFHIALSEDQYFDNQAVEQHMRIVYKNLRTVHAEVTSHAPSLIEEAEDVEHFFPGELKTYLRKLAS